jgi:hypothetical protein
MTPKKKLIVGPGKLVGHDIATLTVEPTSARRVSDPRQRALIVIVEGEHSGEFWFAEDDKLPYEVHRYSEIEKNVVTFGPGTLTWGKTVLKTHSGSMTTKAGIAYRLGEAGTAPNYFRLPGNGLVGFYYPVPF